MVIRKFPFIQIGAQRHPFQNSIGEIKSKNKSRREI
uniref:Uncharacterized protein n=1 Tax=Siphoviridae sp. ct8NQ14 TaxID=2825363 RepID=A0A8S5PNM6_9CAUD|nr:MAG TPA: hypothetical protein [Siphoviridae sp. ct8NQ14]